jgi:hypothetical protein
MDIGAAKKTTMTELLATADAARPLSANVAHSLRRTIAAALADPTVIEMMINPDGRPWIERGRSAAARAVSASLGSPTTISSGRCSKRRSPQPIEPASAWVERNLNVQCAITVRSGWRYRFIVHKDIVFR